MSTSLHIQSYLRARLSASPDGMDEVLSELDGRFCIASKRHPMFPNLVLLKYQQTRPEIDWTNPMVRECRGLILDEGNDFAIVCRPFDKFFNWGEVHADPIDWPRATVEEKVDGSLMSLYFYGGEWRVASSGTPDAGGPVENEEQTFASYFWQTWLEMHGGLDPVFMEGRALDLSSHLPKHMTFMFELSGPRNRVVVVHEKAKLTVLGARNIRTGEIHPSASVQSLFFPHLPAVKDFPLQNIDQIAASFASFTGVQSEGYVVRDGYGRRIKVKHPGYVALHHAKDGFSDRALFEISRKGEVSEAVVYFPEIGKLLEAHKARLERFYAKVQKVHEQAMAESTSQKEYAEWVSPYPFKAVCFMLRAGKVGSPSEYGAKALETPFRRMVDATEEAGLLDDVEAV